MHSHNAWVECKPEAGTLVGNRQGPSTTSVFTMGACLGSEEKKPQPTSTVVHEAPKATTSAAQVIQSAPEKKYCGTDGYDDSSQRALSSAVFFADFDQTFAKAHTFKVRSRLVCDGDLAKDFCAALGSIRGDRLVPVLGQLLVVDVICCVAVAIGSCSWVLL